ncbi:MAG: LamG domain-containing protein [Fimbriimonadaceae bacterium]|nr:LamG domain-containing protein [Fimbriimonadaceae bacterium]
MVLAILALWTTRAAAALQFDGNTCAWVADCPALRLTDELTIEAWLKLDETIVNRTFAMVVSKNWETTGYELTVLDRPNHRLHGTDLVPGHADKPILPLGKWIHVAYARSLSKAKLYVDGKLVTTRPTGSPLLPNDLPMWIGSSNLVDQEGKPCRFIGSIAEIRLWSAARSEANIRRTRNRRLHGRETHLVAVFDFRKGGGQLIANPTRKTGPLVLGTTAEPDPQDPTWVSVGNLPSRVK